jgi:ribose/xylose/arabinose/galactoside ABC-type transport system permease subunit
MSEPEAGQSSVSPTSTGNAVTEPTKSGKLRKVKWNAFGSSVTFLVFIAVFAWYSIWLGEKFLNTNPRLLDVHQNVPLLLISLGLTVCLISGQFDLSVGGMATLTTYLAVGLTILQEWPFWLVITTCIVVGVLGGSLNAFLVVKLRVNPFIATLGTGGILVGLSRVYSGGAQLAPTGDGPTLPEWFSGSASLGSYQNKALPIITWLVLAFLLIVIAFVVSERVPSERRRLWFLIIAINVVVLFTVTVVFVESLANDMSYIVLFLLAVTFTLWVIMRYTTFGRYLYATGGNAEAAELAGVNVKRMKSAAFIISSTLAALAGVVLASIQGSASPGIAVGYLLPAFAAAFLGTVILSTGRFHIWGTLIGGIFVIWVGQGLIVGGVSFTWTDVINGSVLVVAVSLSTALRRGGRK